MTFTLFTRIQLDFTEVLVYESRNILSLPSDLPHIYLRRQIPTKNIFFHQRAYFLSRIIETLLSSFNMLHHLMIGTWTPPGAIFTVAFDDEALTLELVKRTSIPEDEPISWMTFDVSIAVYEFPQAKLMK